MKNTKRKLEEVNDLALKIGFRNCSDIEQDIFKRELCQLVITAIDESRKEMYELMSNQADKIIEYRNDEF